MLPSDLSFWHLQPTWLYWLLLAFLLIELAWLGPATFRALRSPQKGPTAGPWGSTTAPSPLLRVSYVVSLVSSVLTVVLLMLLSAAAFYTAAFGVLARILRFAAQIPQATGGEQIGAVIGELIGGLLQILLILGAIASIDPTSDFPFRLKDHVTHDT